jgi:hypothetical protein
MYKKISQDSVNAFLNKETFNRENMAVSKGVREYDDCWYLMLFGNTIAKMLPDGTIFISTCGWHTRTTQERLNCLLYTLGSTSRLRIRKFEPFLETQHGLLPWADDFMVRYRLDTKLY